MTELTKEIADAISRQLDDQYSFTAMVMIDSQELEDLRTLTAQFIREHIGHDD